MYEARIERDSITQYGERLTTFVVTLPRIVLAELNTHRMLSKSSASSRAIPVNTQIERLRDDPFRPVYWGKNQKGMQAEQELTAEEIAQATEVWDRASADMIAAAEKLLSIGVHKQITNRLLEPWMWHTVIITGTEWSNFFHLRDNKMAQPEIQKAAAMMNELYQTSRPKLLQENEWHSPFMLDEESAEFGHRGALKDAIFCSVGRAARVSYLNHDGKRDIDEDIGLAQRCLDNGHMAPFEHVARPMTAHERQAFAMVPPMAGPKTTLSGASWIYSRTNYFAGNFNGWLQARKTIHAEHDILSVAK